MATENEPQQQAATGTAGNAPEDVTTGGADAAELTAAVRAFADSGGSALSDEDLAALDQPAPGNTVGPGGATIGGAVGGVGTAGTYTAAGTAAGSAGGMGASQSLVGGSPTGAAQASESTLDQADDATAAFDDDQTGDATAGGG